MSNPTYITDMNGVVVDAASVPVPANRNFRDAWKKEGATVVVDMVAARALFRAKLEEAEAQMLTGDVGRAVIDAFLTNDNAAKAALQTKRSQQQAKKVNGGVDAATTPEELAALWDESLFGPSPFA